MLLWDGIILRLCRQNSFNSFSINTSLNRYCFAIKNELFVCCAYFRRYPIDTVDINISWSIGSVQQTKHIVSHSADRRKKHGLITSSAQTGRYSVCLCFFISARSCISSSWICWISISRCHWFIRRWSIFSCKWRISNSALRLMR